VCVLASLLNSDSYGYKIIQSLSGIIDISESTLYPILRRLEANKCLESYSVENNGRLRKFYSITSLGEEKIKDYLKDFKELMMIYNYIAKEVKENVE
jgi:PadR family transcriptional regulator PadR